MAFQTFVSVIFVPVLIKMTKRFDKRTMFLAGMGIAMAASVVYGIAGIPNAAQMFVYSFFLSIGSICYWQLIAAMVYDVSEQPEGAFRHGHLHAVHIRISFGGAGTAASGDHSRNYHRILQALEERKNHRMEIPDDPAGSPETTRKPD